MGVLEKAKREGTMLKVTMLDGVVVDRLFEATSITYNNAMYEADGKRKTEYYGTYDNRSALYRTSNPELIVGGS